jgi:hypothetical protein
MINTAVTKLLTVKAAAVVFAVTAAGGVAAAAATGTLPTALTGSDGKASAGISVAASHRSDKASADPSESEKGKGPEGAKGSPSPSLVGLCHAVSAGNKDEHGKALESPAFMALITAAGGKEKVDAFCAAILASASADPKDHSSHPADSQSDRRSGAPTDHSTGKPSSTPAHP